MNEYERAMFPWQHWEPSSTRISLKRKTTIETRKKNCCQQVPGSSNKMILNVRLIVRYCKLYEIDHKNAVEIVLNFADRHNAYLHCHRCPSKVQIHLWLSNLSIFWQRLATTSTTKPKRTISTSTPPLFSAASGGFPLPRKEWNVEPENHKRQVWGHCSQPPHLPKGLAWKVEPLKMQESSRSTRIS